MPWEARKRGSKWVVVQLDTGKVVGTHDGREAAVAQIKALYANAPPEEKPRLRADRQR